MKNLYLLIVILVTSVTLFAQQNNISEILDSAGTIKAGANGSFSAQGYRMQFGENNKPVFKKIEKANKTNSFTWESLGSGRDGTNGKVSAIAADASGNIYVGGEFNLIGEMPANFVAKWDGSKWSALISSDGINGVYDFVNAIAVDGNNNVYVGGSFTLLGDGLTPAKYIAKWNGRNWSALTSGTIKGLDGFVKAVAIDGNKVYVGGGFSALSDATPANHIAKWDISSGTWSALTNTDNTINGVNSCVNAIAVDGCHSVYVGGCFTKLSDGTAANYVAKWSGGTWSSLTCTDGTISIIVVGNTVYALATEGNNIYIGGNFTSLSRSDGNTVAVNNIAKWDTISSTWSALTCSEGNTGVSNPVNSISITNGNVYIGGDFKLLGNGTTTVNYIAKWSISSGSWSALTSTDGITAIEDGGISAVCATGTKVYVGGGPFSVLGGGNYEANNIALWNDNGSVQSWSKLGSGSNGATNNVNALAVKDNDVYVGGEFSFVGDGIKANCVAKWNITSSSWSALVSSDGKINGIRPSVASKAMVKALAIDGNCLYVGGSFTALSDGTLAGNIAKWDIASSSWAALSDANGNGVGSYVNTLAVDKNNKLYVGGTFTALGSGTSANRIAMWSNNQWSALSNGVNNEVLALTIDGNNNVYAGGKFTIPAKYVAKWNGTSWSALGNGLGNYVYALAVDGNNNLYAGGNFTTLGDNTTSANRVAKWSGTSWSALENGINGAVYSLFVDGTSVYAGGSFTKLGDETTDAFSLVKWDGNRWSAVDQGVNGKVCSIMKCGSSFYLGGSFDVLNDTKLAYFVGSFTDPSALPVELVSLSACVEGSSVVLNWKTATEINNCGFDIERMNGDWIKIGFVSGAGNSNSPRSYSYTDNNVKPGRYSYRLKQTDNDGKYTYSSAVEVNTSVLPGKLVLDQNYPNPFNPSTTISYQLPEKCRVTIKIFDMLGKEVAEIVNEEKEAGSYVFTYNASSLGSGVYVYQIKAGSEIRAKKFTLLK
jgi:hypothetical protein